jgi:hypothetical protein
MLLRGFIHPLQATSGITSKWSPWFSSAHIPHHSTIHNLQTKAVTLPVRKAQCPYEPEGGGSMFLRNVSTRSQSIMFSKFTDVPKGQLSYHLTVTSTANAALNVGHSFRAQHRMGQELTVQILLVTGIPCCRTSSACTRTTMMSNAVHITCLQLCPRQTPFIMNTILLRLGSPTFYTLHTTP